MIKYLLIGLLFVMVACSKDIEVDQPPYESKIVVDGFINAEGYANVYLTNSSPFLTDYDSASIRATFVNDAKVTVSNTKGDREILTLYRKSEFFPPFVYRSTELKGEVGETYLLKIEVDGQTIESSTTIPDFPNILSVGTYSVSDTTMQIDIEIKDDGNEENFYYTEIKVKDIDSIFHQASFPLIDDTDFNGSNSTIRVYHSNPPDPLNIYQVDTIRNIPAYQFSVEETIYIKFSSLDETSFKILKDIYLDGINSDNPFAFVNKKNGTNIEGGIGRWTGMATRYLVVSNK